MKQKKTKPTIKPGRSPNNKSSKLALIEPPGEYSPPGSKVLKLPLNLKTSWAVGKAKPKSTVKKAAAVKKTRKKAGQK